MSDICSVGGFKYNMNPIRDSVVNENFEPNDVQEKILEALKEGREEGKPWGRANPKYLTKQIGERRQYINRDLSGLVDAGWIRQPVRGLYEFVEDPREEL
jgi:hypothetical protein